VLLTRPLATDEPSFIAESSFVRAPLNSRVGPSPARPKSSSKGKAREERLDALSVELQEALILEDLLFVLMVPSFFCASAGFWREADGRG
jgi:gamma-tubulin complex component 2